MYESFGIVFLGCFCYKTGGNAARFFDRAFCIDSMLNFFGKARGPELVGKILLGKNVYGQIFGGSQNL